LTPPLRLKLLGFSPDTRLFVKHPPFQFAEESFSCEFLLGNFERFLDIIIEDFDFHASRLCAFPGDACIGFLSQKENVPVVFSAGLIAFAFAPTCSSFV
jgi:hypothetical protein